jgi:hypothetical protein
MANVPAGDWFATLGEYTVIGGRLVVASWARKGADATASAATTTGNAATTGLIAADG